MLDSQPVYLKTRQLELQLKKITEERKNDRGRHSVYSSGLEMCTDTYTHIHV